MRVENLMSSDVWTCEPDDALDKPAALMWRHDIGVVPVVDAERRIQGILTDRDIAMAAVLNGRPLRHIRVADVMSSRVQTCSPSDDLTEAEQRMAQHQVRRLPVVDEESRVVGILSLNDLVSTLSRSQELRVPSNEIAATLEAVSRHRQSAEAAAK